MKSVEDFRGEKSGGLDLGQSWEMKITYDTFGEDDNLQRVNICGAQIDGSSVFIS